MVKNFSMNYMQTDLSDCPSDFEIYFSDMEIDSLSKGSYESDIKPPKRQICQICLYHYM